MDPAPRSQPARDLADDRRQRERAEGRRRPPAARVAHPSRSVPSARTDAPDRERPRQAAPQVRASVRLHASNGQIPTSASSTIESGTINDWKNGRADRHLRAPDRFGHERVDGSPEHDDGHRREQHARREERRLSRATDPKRPAAPSFGRRQTISPADTSTTSPVNPSSSGPIVDSANAWTDDTTPDRVRNVPKIDERERRREQRHVPRLHDATLLLHRCRVQEDRRGEPRKQAGVLHRVPGPVAAPAELHVRPARAEEDAGRQQDPRPERPPANLVAAIGRRASPVISAAMANANGTLNPTNPM